eukprot:CAMPEP_0170615176 /NCGR_PEP_ID=MMETSP0224-20130122/25197_1 /TAXON_ID=285029 /ORGANISM="Togula jolla, Strain CCCM 725" /LENGTH=140 /DNA_ID=CAMNT_0010940889 /DNA_START=30 /DNA_END=452 /DNA_ORIENTATION=-
MSASGFGQPGVPSVSPAVVSTFAQNRLKSRTSALKSQLARDYLLNDPVDHGTRAWSTGPLNPRTPVPRPPWKNAAWDTKGGRWIPSDPQTCRQFHVTGSDLTMRITESRTDRTSSLTRRRSTALSSLTQSGGRSLMNSTC